MEEQEVPVKGLVPVNKSCALLRVFLRKICNKPEEVVISQRTLKWSLLKIFYTESLKTMSGMASLLSSYNGFVHKAQYPT